MNEVIRSILNVFFFTKIFYTHPHTNTHTLIKHRKIKSSSEMYKVRTLFSYVLSVNVRTLKIIINLIKHKNAYKQTKTKKAVFL